MRAPYQPLFVCANLREEPSACRRKARPAAPDASSADAPPIPRSPVSSATIGYAALPGMSVASKSDIDRPSLSLAPPVATGAPRRSAFTPKPIATDDSATLSDATSPPGGGAQAAEHTNGTGNDSQHASGQPIDRASDAGDNGTATAPNGYAAALPGTPRGGHDDAFGQDQSPSTPTLPAEGGAAASPRVSFAPDVAMGGFGAFGSTLPAGTPEVTAAHDVHSRALDAHGAEHYEAHSRAEDAHSAENYAPTHSAGTVEMQQTLEGNAGQYGHDANQAQAGVGPSWTSPAQATFAGRSLQACLACVNSSMGSDHVDALLFACSCAAAGAHAGARRHAEPLRPV